MVSILRDGESRMVWSRQRHQVADAVIEAQFITKKNRASTPKRTTIFRAPRVLSIPPRYLLLPGRCRCVQAPSTRALIFALAAAGSGAVGRDVRGMQGRERGVGHRSAGSRGVDITAAARGEACAVSGTARAPATILAVRGAHGDVSRRASPSHPPAAAVHGRPPPRLSAPPTTSRPETETAVCTGPPPGSR